MPKKLVEGKSCIFAVDGESIVNQNKHFTLSFLSFASHFIGTVLQNKFGPTLGTRFRARYTR